MGGLRRLGILITAAALVPLLLFWMIEVGFKAREERRAVEARALSTSLTVMARADGIAERAFAGANTLATARSLRAGLVDEFRTRAAELIGLNKGWVAVSLVDRRTGGVLFTVGQGDARYALSLGGRAGPQPRFAGFARGPGCPCIVVDRIANGLPGRPAILRLLVSNREITATLPPPSDEYFLTAIADKDGRFIARTINGDQRFGLVGTTFLQRAIGSGRAQGFYRGQTLEGTDNITAFTRSSLTGWSTHVALRAMAVDDPARRFIQSLGVAALLSLALAAILIWIAIRQISEGRRIAERMQQAQKLEALGQLTGGIAHDFNNLLTPVVGTLDFVARKPGTDPGSRRLLLGALASAERAGKLTAQLLTFSRRQRLAIEPIAIAPMMEDMADLFRQSIGDEHRLDISQDDPTLCAQGDVGQLELAILNLLINARDASPPGSAIAITVSGRGDDADGDVIIAIRDEGAGMDEETRHRAIEPFFTTKAVGRGTGLGLAQVFGMATQSGGRLDIISAPGEGTTVSIVLKRCAPTLPRKAPREAEPPSARALRLLVVDDEPAVRAAIIRPLEDAGHIVDAVSDAPTALAALGQRAFDLVLVDFAMPGMTGAELIRRAHGVRSGTRFVIVTGYADSEALAIDAPGTPVLVKPFDNAELLAMVSDLAG